MQREWLAEKKESERIAQPVIESILH